MKKLYGILLVCSVAISASCTIKDSCRALTVLAMKPVWFTAALGHAMTQFPLRPSMRNQELINSLNKKLRDSPWPINKNLQLPLYRKEKQD